MSSDKELKAIKEGRVFGFYNGKPDLAATEEFNIGFTTKDVPCRLENIRTRAKFVDTSFGGNCSFVIYRSTYDGGAPVNDSDAFVNNNNRAPMPGIVVPPAGSVLFDTTPDESPDATNFVYQDVASPGAPSSGTLSSPGYKTIFLDKNTSYVIFMHNLDTVNVASVLVDFDLVGEEQVLAV
jgi:hypothetical protein